MLADTLSADLYVACLGTVLAVLEVQIEGPHGWAEKLPTWRPSGPVARAAARAFGGKPITGYHLVLVLFLLMCLHLPASFAGPGWTLRDEAWALSRFFLLSVFWDFQWFVLNPHFGLARFNGDTVWWHRRWLFGRLPADYVFGVLIAALLSAPWPRDLAVGLGVFAAQTLVVTAVGEALWRKRRAGEPAKGSASERAKDRGVSADLR